MHDQFEKKKPVFAPIFFNGSSDIDHLRNLLLTERNRSLTENLSSNELVESINFSQINGIFENLAKIIGLPMAIIDFSGKVIASSEWQRLCMALYRINPKTLAGCNESNKNLFQQATHNMTGIIFHCRNGLIDCAAPIIIEDKAIANICIGQFLLEAPDLDYFRSLQKECDFNDAEYFKELNAIPILSKETLIAILKLLIAIAQLIGMQSLAGQRAIAAYKTVEQQVTEHNIELSASHELLHKLSEQVPGIIYQFRLNPDGSFCLPYASEGIRDVFELTPEEVKKNAELLFTRIHPEDIEHVKSVIRESALNLSPWQDQYRIILPDKGLRWCEGNAIPEKLADGSTLWHGFISDISCRKLHEDQLEYVAHYDPLTNLPNRNLLADRLQQALLQSQRQGHYLAVAYLDLDGFKAINDRYGHSAGDELLVAIAQQMKAVLRDGDTLARIGGDEFVAVLVNLENPRNCEQVLDRLLQAAFEPLAIGEFILQVSASIGVTIYPQDQANAEQLIRHADQAMYQAKQWGKNRYQFFDAGQNGGV